MECNFYFCSYCDRKTHFGLIRYESSPQIVVGLVYDGRFCVSLASIRSSCARVICEKCDLSVTGTVSAQTQFSNANTLRIYLHF